MENQEELSAEQGAAEFAAGINGTATETPPPEESKPDETPPPEYVQVTKGDWEALQARAAKIDEIAAAQGQMRDTAFGRLGSLEQALRELRTSAAGQPVADEDLAQLAAEYPDLAELSIFKKLRTGNAAPGLDEAQIAPLVDQRVSKAREEITAESERKFEMRLLQRDHPDWRATVGISDDGKAVETPYREWLRAQPAEYQQKVGSAWNADIVGESITKFKNHAKTEAARKAAAEARQGRIAAAVPAKGDGSAPQATGKSPFQEGLASG